MATMLSPVAAPELPSPRWTRVVRRVRRVLAGHPRRSTADTRATLAIEQARLEAAVGVARTAAHEVGNALAPVVGFAELLALQPEVAANPTSTAYLQHIVDAAEFAVTRMRQLERSAGLGAPGAVRAEERPMPGPDRCAEPAA